MTENAKTSEQGLNNLKKLPDWVKYVVFPLAVLISFAGFQWGARYFSDFDSNNEKIPILIEQQNKMSVQQDSTRKESRHFMRWISKHEDAAWRQYILDSISACQNNKDHKDIKISLTEVCKKLGIHPVVTDVTENISN